MTTEKMTVHKALAELKVLDDRILAAIGACNLITTKKNNQDKVRGKTVAEFTADKNYKFYQVGTALSLFLLFYKIL